MREPAAVGSGQLSPLCGASHLRRAWSIVRREQRALFSLLPQGHLWEGKLWHMRRTMILVGRTFAPHLRGEVPRGSLGLLAFIAGTHDLGRVIEALLREEGKRLGLSHGEESVKLMEGWGVREALTPRAWEAVSHAVRWHCDVGEATEGEGFLPLWDSPRFYLLALRDLDRMDNLIAKRRVFLFDPRHKEREAKMFPHIGPERGRVLPEELVEKFVRHEPIAVSELASYEGYVVFRLGWLFHFNFPFCFQETVRSGAVEDYLRYLEERVPPWQWCPIRKEVERFICGEVLRLTDEGRKRWERKQGGKKSQATASRPILQ